ncbi:hypothetical protein GCM10008910_46820 [Faecalicatena orotica]|uniref:Uroporphyrinogen decarboxylase (URO-D) domain-containing protein n=1 Tax=Faecalicatena orotica TaxID=1544 RepID=A0A2Y9CA15_9FIRM|nr:hypothetical protein [Faecalicatena orotica]PWJ29376.1 hypothetical protein A8806_106113 [Faecalicatena orotica]SSA55831.1 hypothetical protein SAMN05216536_106113 [Faecalicatena orotica]
MSVTNFYDLDLETKPDFVQCMKRIYAWYDGEIIDRVPVRFSAHNEEYDVTDIGGGWKNLRDKWFDTEYQVNRFISALDSHPWLGETFPMYYPNLGPNFFAAAITDSELEFGEVTSWGKPQILKEEDLERIAFRRGNSYYQKIIEMTKYALERCDNRFMVGYTDMHPSLDCADALRGTEDLCMDMFDEEEFVTALTEKCFQAFFPMMDEFHSLLKTKNQLSVSWMNIPSYESMHIPSCDLGAMISRDFFNQFSLPYIKKEVKHFRHNIFHLDGKGVANHVDELLKIEEIQAVQWVQGVGDDKPIMQWVDFIKKIQEAGKSIVVDLEPEGLEAFMDAMDPRGIYLCIPEKEPEQQRRIMDRLLKWK